MNYNIKRTITYFKLFLIAHCLLFIVHCFGQTATGKLERTSIVIGDQIHLTLEFTGPSDLNVTFPLIKDTITKSVEVVQTSNIETSLSQDKKQKTYRQTLTITSFDSGFYPIRPFRILYTQGKDTARHYAETMALLLSVQNVKVDASKGIRDIKPPLEAKFTFREALPYIIILILIVGGIIFLRYYLKKKKKKEPIFRLPAKPKLPAHEVAFAALEELRNKKLWQSNQIKEFHSELTEIIRKYIEDRFGIQALEMVSDDIIETINHLDIDAKMKSELKEMLTLADLVKFAKENPLPSEHDRSFNNALDFVKNTIVYIQTQEAAAGSSSKQGTKEPMN